MNLVATLSSSNKVSVGEGIMMQNKVIFVMCYYLIYFVLTCAGGHVKFANGLEAQKSWCVAKPAASDIELKNNIEYACNNLDDCKMIQPGGSCYEPNTLINHASVVMNRYYALKGRNTWNCHFSDSALIVAPIDPSYGSCKYA
ncbi:hypothetical protein VNO77_01601 [Canavalia gladiata]|uniref:X8 domain-containing protein n=1 Tax=Canavalia gladiata TaxID=3824 RepID=A0AAN9MRQ1_CANGL